MKLKLYFLLSLFLISFSCGKKNENTNPVRKDITETVFASGTLEPENKYNLTAQADGYILEQRFELGDTLKAGDILAVIDNKPNSISASGAGQVLALTQINASLEGPTLTQAVQNAELLKAKSEEDSAQWIRYKKLFQTNSVSKLEVENMSLLAQTSKTNYLNALQNYRLLKQQTEQQLINQQTLADVYKANKENNEIRAVIGGRVYKKLKEVGDFVKRGEVIAVIGDANELFARLNIDESNISKIRKGLVATVQLNTNKEINYEGYVSKILPAFDDASQSFICEVKFKINPELKISGTQLQANIVIGTKINALVIPRNFLDYGNKVTVKGTENPVEVKTGFVSSEWVEILGGLKEDDVLVNQNK